MDPRARPLDGLWVALSGALAIIAMISPIGASPSTPVGPHWLLIVLGYWCARRPSAPAPMIVFVLGAAHDLLRAGPVGAELFALLIICEALRGISARRQALGFFTEWMRFAGAAVALEALVWSLLAMTYARTPELESVAQRIGLSILAYPIAAYVLEKVFRARGRDGRFDHLRF